MKRSIIIPIDAHAHFRTEDILKDVIPYTASICGHAVVWGNLRQPVDDLGLLVNYRNEIKAATKDYPWFNPVMTIMLTRKTTTSTIKMCAPYAKVLKFIPASTSTNSQSGIRLEDLEDYYPILEEVKRRNMIFSIHAERIKDDNGEEIPEMERERAALPFVKKLIQDIPGLKIIIEHVSTKEACELVLASPDNVAATITAHHSCLDDSFLYNRTTINTTINPEFYCKPVLKSMEDMLFVRKMMLSGNPKFFFGSDSAPWPEEAKFKMTPPAAGLFSAPVAIPMILEKFSQAKRISLAENFLSIFGRNFYGLPIPSQRVIITDEKAWLVPKSIGREKIPVLMGGEIMKWQVKMVN